MVPVVRFGRQQMRYLLLGLAFVLLAGCPGERESAKSVAAATRGIVLVTVDGWWDPATKTDSIPAAFSGVPFRSSEGMTPCPQVRPAICSILTGKSPVETGVRDDVVTPLPATIPLVSQRLTESGWRTAAFIADPRVGHGSGLERGFEIFAPPKDVPLGSFRRLPKVRAPGEVVSDFATWIPSIPDDASFFAWVHLTRPMIDRPTAGSPEDVSTALERLSQLVAGSVRLKGAAFMLVGTAGRIDLDDGAASGYFLSPEVLRVPVRVRSAATGGAVSEARAPVSLLEVAGWIAREAGIEETSHDGSSESGPRLAWTWRGHTEFGWPVELAAQQGSALCVLGIPSPAESCVPWTEGRPVEDVDRSACASALKQGARSAEAPTAIPALPDDLTRALAKLGLRAPSARTDVDPPVARGIRERIVPSVSRARRFADQRKAAEAEREYQKALAIDPKNFGVLIESGETLALTGRSKQAKARLEPALRTAPWNAEAWHWLGHVSYLEKQIDRAETQWRVSDVLEPGNHDVLYDLACARSIAGDAGEAEAYLRRAWNAGFRDVNTIQVDSDLRNLRADPAYLRFMREVVH
jgi:hypothetical protein